MLPLSWLSPRLQGLKASLARREALGVLRIRLDYPFRLLEKTHHLPTHMRTGAEIHQAHDLLLFRPSGKQGSCEERSCVCRAGVLPMLEQWPRDWQRCTERPHPLTPGPSLLPLPLLLLHRISPRSSPRWLSKLPFVPILTILFKAVRRTRSRCTAH